MTRKPLITLPLGIVAGLLLLCGAYYLAFRARTGVAADTQKLAAVYKDAGPAYADFYGISFLRQMPFTEPIAWRRTVVRSSITLTGRVDAAAYKKVLLAEQRAVTRPYSVSLWENRLLGGTSVVHFITHHRVGECVVKTYGSVDLAKGTIWMSSSTLGRKIDDGEWFHMTNGASIDLEDFNEKG